MLVLHAHWHPPADPHASGHVLFWAEDGAAPPPSRDRRVKRAQPHPFAAAPERLRELLGRWVDVAEAATGEVTLQLPTDRHGPARSPSLLHEWELETKSDEEPVLLPWTVAGLRLAPATAFDVLSALPAQDRLPGGDRAGDDVRYWQHAAALVQETLAAQRVQPALVEVQPRKAYVARWQPVLDAPEDGPRRRRLVEAMPPLCRAATDDPAKAPHPRALLDAFLDATTDALAREAARDTLTAPGDPTVARRWLDALATDDPTVYAPGEPLHHLYASYRRWLRNLHVSGDATFRIAFRLEAPEQQAPEARDWTLHFLLQARDDPSLMLPAERVWQHGGDVLDALDRTFHRPQEKLLAGLGYAARLFEPLRRGLQTARPDAVALATDEAYTFLRECVPLLEQSGFGILVPPWWTRPDRRLGVRVKVKSSGAGKTSSGKFTLESLLDYDWTLALGETALSREEFDALVQLKEPLVQLRGQWVRLDTEQVEAAIAFWERRREHEALTFQEVLQMGLAEQAELDGLPVEDVDFEGELGDWMEHLRGESHLRELPAPDGLEATLRPYQRYGFSWLDFMHRSGLGAILADDMGLGKCVGAGTRVLVNDTFETAEAIWSQHARDVAFDGEGYWSVPSNELHVNALDPDSGRIMAAPVRQLYRQWVREPLRRVTLEDGSSVTITEQHKLLTPKGWTTDVAPGDYVCVPARLIHTSDSPDDLDLAVFLAWQIAEGYELPDKGRLHISQKDVARLVDLRQLLRRIASHHDIQINEPSIHERPPRVAQLEIQSEAYRRFLEERGYRWGERSAGKSIPPFIMQAGDEVVRAFLRHFFAAEGCVESTGRTVSISSASRTLIGQLSVLLRRFSIWLRVRSSRKCATNGKGIFRTYYLGTLGGESARRFADEIGFADSDKQQKLESVVEIPSNTNVEGIPASHIVAALVEETGLPLRHLGMHNTVYVDGSQQFSENSLARVAACIDDVLSGEAERAYRRKPRSRWTERTLAAYEGLNHDFVEDKRREILRLLDQDVFYCRVADVDVELYEGWVYDFEVEHHHNYVAEHILCHNTVQTLTLFQHDREQDRYPGPVLLVCPTSVVTNWAREARRFTPELRVVEHHGPDRRSGEAFAEQAREHDLVLTSYALARRDADDLREVDWYGLVLDEAQAVKNPDTKQARVLRSLPAGFRLALTGTPIENRLSELWSIMHFLNPGFLGPRKQFQRTFARPIERHHDEEAARRLRVLTQPFILRRVKTDPTVIQDLPEKQETKVYCHLTEEQATLYEAVVRDTMAEIQASEGIGRKGLVLSMLMKLKQVCNHPVQFLHEREGYRPEEDHGRSGKLERFSELIETIHDEGGRALLFTQFTEMAELLRRYVQERLGLPTLFLHGGTPGHRRDELVQQFQQDDEAPPLFILSLKAGGTGLNLTRANHVFHFDRWWNPAVEDQATDRAFRIGQKRNVLVHKFVCVGTLEERIDEMIEAKKDLADRIVGQGENWLTEMSTDDLRDLVSLRRETIAAEE